jgi:hypothetical protein
VETVTAFPSSFADTASESAFTIREDKNMAGRAVQDHTRPYGELALTASYVMK